MPRRLIIFILYAAFSFECFGQLVVYSNGKEENVFTKNISYSINEGVTISDSALLNLQHNWNSLGTGQISLKDFEETIWYKIPLNSFIQANATDYIEIREPNINQLQVWVTRNGEIVKRFERTGDNTPFSTRTIPASTFIFPLEGKLYKDCELIIATDKRHTRYFIPLFFASSEYHEQDMLNNKIKIAGYLGITTILILFQIYLFTKTKQQWSKWLSMYLILLLVFILVDNSFLFRYIYPNHPLLNDVMHPILLSGCFLPFLLFMTSILDLKKNAPKFYKINKIIKWVFVYLLVIAALTSYRSNYFLQGYWVTTGRIVTPICVFLIFIESVYCWYDKFRYSGWLLLLSFCGFYQLVIYILYQYISLPYSLNVADSFYYRFGIELIVISIISLKSYRTLIAGKSH